MTVPNDSSPLLANDNERDGEVDAESLVKTEKAVTPLPKREMFVLCVMRFSEPVSYNLIFPFINEMIISVGIENPGYSSGLVEGTFSFAQLCTVYFWGSLSDRIGRRPVLLCGLAGVAVFTVLFGLSRTFWMIMLFRFLAGASNGNVAVIKRYDTAVDFGGITPSLTITLVKSAIAELTDETNQGRAFSFVPLSWAFGTTAAPLIGGFLSRPAEQFPNVFGDWTIFKTYPYLLPCLAGASITVVGWLIGFFFLEETLGGYHAKQPSAARTLVGLSYSSVTAVQGASVPKYGSTATNTSAAAEDAIEGPIAEEAPRMTVRQILSDKIIQRILVSYVFLALVTSSSDAILPLWLYMPLDKGGIGFTTAQIGVILSCLGFLGTFVNLAIFPPLERRIGAARVYRLGMAGNVLMVSMFPLIHAIALAERNEGSLGLMRDSPGLFTKMAVAVLIVVKCNASMVFASNMILVSRSPPTRTSLGAVNGVAQMVASFVRAAGPTSGTILFALSNDPKYRFVGGQLIWVWLVAVAVVGVFAASRVQEGRGDQANSR